MNRGTVQPAGNYYDKYGSRNPIVRWMMAEFMKSFEILVRTSGADRALEIGCGEAELSMAMVRQGLQVSGCDVAPEAVTEAHRRVARAGMEIDLWVQSLEAFEGEASRAAPLVVCYEVLEHLDDPDRGLDILASLADPWLICSVPREPLWRMLNMARARYLLQLGNTPGHVNHWSRNQFEAFVARRFEIVSTRTPLPWTMLLCRRRME